MSLPDAQTNQGRHSAREPRHLSLLAGKLVYGDKLLTLDCSIRDCSEHGARVRLFAAEPLPGNLWMLNLRTGKAYEAAVAWRRYPDVGLVFVGEVELASPETAHAKVLRRLMIEGAPRQGNPAR